MDALAPPALPFREAPSGERRRGSHVLDRRSAQSLLGHDGLVVLADQVLEDVGVGENPLAHGFHGRRELRDVANALEGDSELMNHLRVGLLAETIQQPGETPEFLPGERIERHVRDAGGESWRNTEAGEQEAVLGPVERFKELPAAAHQLLLEPLDEHRLRQPIGLVELFELAAEVGKCDVDVMHRAGCLAEPPKRVAHGTPPA